MSTELIIYFAAKKVYNATEIGLLAQGRPEAIVYPEPL